MHTPGPWTIEEYGDDECPALVIHRDTESRICFMATPGSHGDPAQITADAYLIAAAPQLLQAIKSLRNEINGIWHIAEHALRQEIGNTNYQVMADKIEEASAAIAKAEGK